MGMQKERRAAVRPTDEPTDDALTTRLLGSIDPTLNVKEMVRLEVRRQDDLRWAEARAVRELMNQRAEHESRTSALIQQHLQELAAKETDRLDAIRAVDRDAVTRAAEVSAAQASTLAATVATSAEALRGQVEAQRITTAEALTNALSPITTRLDSVLAAQFAQQGEKLAKTETRTETKFAMSTAVAIAAAVLSTVLAVVAVTVALYLGLRSPKSSVPTVGAAVACSTPGLLPGQVCTTTSGTRP